MTSNLEKLNCMNYQVNYTDSDGEGYYYLQDGLRSLYRMSKRTNSNFKENCRILLEIGQIVGLKSLDGVMYDVTMI